MIPLNEENKNIQSEITSNNISALQNEKYVSFDQILTKTGFGKYNILLLCMMGILGMADGAESLNLSLVLPIMEKIWGIHDWQESLLGSCVFSGYFIGSLFSGKIADKHGRKKPFILSSISIFAIATISAFSIDFWMFLCFRLIFGILVGFAVPISFTILAENMPLKQRGSMLALVGIFYTMGELSVCLIALLTMQNLQSGNWRLLLALSSFPGILSFVLSIFFLIESPRYLITTGKQEAAVRNLYKIAKFNGQDKFQISEKEQYELFEWSNNYQESFQSESGSIKALFKGKFKIITSIIWYNWFVSAFVFFGITFLLPITLSKLNDQSGNKDNDQEDLWTITYSALGELPTVLFASVLVNIKYFGRKNSWALAYFVGGITCCLLIFEIKNSFVYLITVSKLGFSLAFTLSYEYTGEIYPTYIRASGLGLAGAFSRVGSIIMPFIGIYISNIGLYIPYFIYGVTSLIASVGTFFFLQDTKDMELDQLPLDQKEEKK